MSDYLLIRHFDDKLDTIVLKLDQLLEGHTENEVLRAQILALVNEANIAQVEKDALLAKLGTAFAKSAATESKMRAGVPST